MTDFMKGELGGPKIVDRATFQVELDVLRVREKAHTHEGDAIAAARLTAADDPMTFSLDPLEAVVKRLLEQ